MDKYEFTPIVVVKDEKGNLLITEDKLKEMLKEAYTNGFLAGQLSKSDSSPTIIQPAQPYIPYIPPYQEPYKTTPFWYEKFYCISTGGSIDGQTK